MIEDFCIRFELFLVAFLLKFFCRSNRRLLSLRLLLRKSLFTAVSCSSDNSLLRDTKPSRSSSFRSDKVFARSDSVSDGILTIKLEKFES